MAQELSQQSVEEALGNAFGEVAPERELAIKPEPPEPIEAEDAEAPAVEEPAEGEEAEAEQPDEDAAPIVEPEYEIEVNNQRQTVKGDAQIRELLQKGAHYTQTMQHAARVQDALVAKAQSLAITERFQGEIAEDLAALKSLDRALEQYNAVNWAEKFDTDPIEAMKLHAARNELRDARGQKFSEVQGKWQQFQQGQAQAAQQMLVAEQEALLSRVPEWRNPEKASAEKGEIARALLDRYGFNPLELNNLTDHRALLVARDALRYHQMQAVKTDKVKQAREAPPVVKPGTVQKQSNAKADFVKVRAHLRQLGNKGNHKAQEALVTEMFSKAFKI